MLTFSTVRKMENDGLMTDIRRKDLEIIRLMAERNKMAQSIPDDMVAELSKRTSELYSSSGPESGLESSVCIRIAEAVNESASIRAFTSSDLPPMKVAIVGGAGKMGEWTSRFLSASGHDIMVVDPASGNGLTLDDCGNADAVIVSVPIHATEGILRKLDSVCREDALIFDLTSLKSPMIETLRDMASRRKVCSIHPMFGPSAKSISGRNLIVCDCGNQEATETASKLFEGRGGNIRIMPVEKHDEYMSYVLGLSHAVNIAFFTVLDRSGIPFRDMQGVASTTFMKNLDTNTSVALEDPMLYYDIQHLNAHREGMWKLFCDAVRDLKAASLDSDPAKFVELMENGRNYFS